MTAGEGDGKSRPCQLATTPFRQDVGGADGNTTLGSSPPSVHGSVRSPVNTAPSSSSSETRIVRVPGRVEDLPRFSPGHGLGHYRNRRDLQLPPAIQLTLDPQRIGAEESRIDVGVVRRVEYLIGLLQSQLT
jgi:hypothetical protein